MRRSAFLAAGGLSCAEAPPPDCLPPAVAPSGLGGNVLVVLMDDVGVDRIAAYGVHPRPARTPNLDALAARGRRFRAAYAEPVCSPGRAALLTGRRPVRNGIGQIVRPGFDRTALPLREVLIPEALPAEWTSVAIGKWHLSAFDAGSLLDPLAQGFVHFDGIWGNPEMAVTEDVPVELRGYDRWENVVDGEISWSRGYLTTVQVDRAIDAVRGLPEPWFVYLATSAAHHPAHEPPPGLAGPATPGAPAGDAVVEALDHELGRLFDALDDHTTVVVTSDNGTAPDYSGSPSRLDAQKGTLYPGGIQVPLIVAGPDVVPGVEPSLAHVTDLLPTVLDLAGVSPPPDLVLDGTSLIPALVGDPGGTGRRCVVVDSFPKNGRPPLDARDRNVAVVDAALHWLDPADGPEVVLRARPGSADPGPDLRSAGPLGPADREALRAARAIGRATVLP